jgi:pimeloyl-ACP methyl ester carboxylesterase
MPRAAPCSHVSWPQAWPAPRPPAPSQLSRLSRCPAQLPAKSGLAQLKDVSLWYWDTGGEGVPVVLLHPFTGSAHVWGYQQPVLARAGHRVIGYSRRGFQDSEPGPKDRLGTGAGDLEQLLDLLGVREFHAVASAGGAFVAADFALSRPERVRSLVLACSILGIRDPAFAALTDGLRDSAFDALPAHFRELGPSYRAADPSGTAAWQALERASQPGEKIQQPYANTITLPSLQQLHMPVLLISGDADLIAPPPVARLLQQHLSGSELVVLSECGHSAYWERPLGFNAAVLDFLKPRAKT